MTDIIEQLRLYGELPLEGDDNVDPLISVMNSLAHQAADEIERLRALTEWQPIETAPKDGTEVLAITKYGKQCTMRNNGERFVRIIACRRCGGMGLGTLTHWQPLSIPPEDV